MRIIVVLLLYAVVVIAELRSIRTAVNSSRMESRILDGQPALGGEHKYIASLQLENVHICSAALFQKGFLVTTGECAMYIEIGMHKKGQKGFAVLGHSDLSKGQNVGIEKFAYHPRFFASVPVRLNNYWDLAVVEIADGLDYSSLKVLTLLPNTPYFRVQGSMAMLCGWGTVTTDQEGSDKIGNGQYSDNLHCMYVHLYNYKICTPIMPHGNYQRKLVCGQGDFKTEKSTLGDLGSPLVMTFEVGNQYVIYLVGITLHRYEAREGTYLRFIRADRASRDIRQLVNKFKPLSKASVIQDNSNRSVPDSDPAHPQMRRRKMRKILDESE